MITKRSTRLALLLGLFILTTPSVKADKGNPPWQGYLTDPTIDSILNTMTLREMIGQLIWVPAYADAMGGNYRSIEELVSRHGIGGIIFFEGSSELQREYTRRIKEVSKLPLIIAIDAEWGTGMRLSDIENFPWQLTLGALEDDSLIYRMGAAIARQCHDVGVNINLAPVADVNNNPLNPVINYRSFGEDPVRVAAKAAMFMKGMQDNGILACAKHFPGHGDTDTDSHKSVPVISGDRQRFDNIELLPFMRLINEGVGALMTGHISVPALDESGLPSTFSHKVVTGLLREEAGYGGLIITDAMNMAAATKTFPPGVADFNALIAGNDVIEFPVSPLKALDEIASRVESGELAASQITDRVRRVLAAKLWIASCQPGKNDQHAMNSGGDQEGRVPDGSTAGPGQPALIHELYAGAMTLVENRANLIPLARPDLIRIATVSVNRLAMTGFQKMVDRYASADHYFIDPSNEVGARFIMSKLKDYDLVIAGFGAMAQKPSGGYGVTPALSRIFSEIAALEHSAVIWFGSPYGLARLDLSRKPAAMLVAYQDNSFTQDIAVQVLFGAIGASGRLPVTVGDSYPAGTGIKTAGSLRLRYAYPENAGLSSEKLISRVDSIVNEALDTLAFPGCHVIIARRGTVVFNKCYGFHLFDSTEAVTEYDLWDLASVTKVASATPSLMVLDDRGLFDPDKTLGYYLPWYRFSNKGDMLLRDMLAHQAGLRPGLPFWQNTMENDSTYRRGLYRDYANRRFALPVSDSLYINRSYLKEMFRAIRDSPLGPKKYLYSDLTFILAAEIIESLTDSTIDKFAPANIYRPLGAFNITYRPLEKYPRARIVPTEYDSLFRKQLIRGTVHDEATSLLGGVSGHAGLFASGNDLMKVIEMYRRGGEYGGVRILSREVLQRYTTVQYPENDNRRALGFDKPLLGNDTIPADEAYPCPSASPSSYGHSGFTGTFIWVDPDEEISYLFLSNRVYPTRRNSLLSDLSVRGRILQAVYDARL